MILSRRSFLTGIFTVAVVGPSCLLTDRPRAYALGSIPTYPNGMVCLTTYEDVAQYFMGPLQWTGPPPLGLPNEFKVEMKYNWDWKNA